MKNIGWKDIVEFIGILAIVGSLIFVGLQMQQSRQIALNEAGYNRIANMIEESNAWFENADVWIRGNAGEELNRTDATIHKRLIQVSWERAFWVNSSDLKLGGSSLLSIHDYAWFLHQNPGARRVWEEDAKERNDARTLLLGIAPGGIAMQDIVRADLEKLDQLKP